MSGLMSGIALARAGQQVAIISAGQSALHFSSGSFELYGGAEHPLEGIATLPAEHPYQKLGVERVAHYAEQTQELLREAGIPTTGSTARNHYRFTPIGMVKPAWLTLIIYSFQGLWNAGASMYIHSEQLKSFNYAIGQITAGGIARAGASAASTVIMMMVPITVFVVSQSNIIETMGSSGMKD